MNDKLWYKTEPKGWGEGLVIGDGRLAATVLNYASEDVLALNHEYIWSHMDKNREIEITKNALETVRKLLLDGKYEEGTIYANKHLGRNGNCETFVNRTGSYQPAGNLHFKFLDTGIAQTRLKERRLDLINGIANAERIVDGAAVKGEFLTHFELSNVLCHWTGEINGEIFFERPEEADSREKMCISGNTIKYNVSFKAGIDFCVVINIFTDGNLIAKDNGFLLNDAKYVIAAINIATEAENLEEELKKYNITDEFDWNEAALSHSKVFTPYMKRMYASIGDKDYEDIPTDDRIAAFKKGIKDEQIFALYLTYSRYLLLSSTYNGKLPANLQGKWNDKVNPPWHSDYHFDINIQMNYWIAESGNLSELTKQLFDYVESFNDSAERAAKTVYDCRGIVLPLSSDCLGKSTFESYRWDLWIGAAAWMAQHFWKHFEYTGDVNFLKEHAYPYFKKVAEFYEDYVTEDENGTYQLIPSCSPENSFLPTDDFPISLGISSAMDVQLAYDALSFAINSSKILNADREKANIWQDIRDRLPEFKIGADGRLLEWNEEKYEKEPGHRHLSHLYGIFPGDLFTTETRQKQFEAGIKSLDFRMSHDGGHTGWSRAWCACLYARMRRTEDFYHHMRSLITSFSTVSLLDLHPHFIKGEPGIFQIDGNFGGGEAIIQSLIQCTDGKIYLLPTLPKEWDCGEICGVKTIGGHTVSFKWKNGKVTDFSIIFGFKEKAVIKLSCGKEIYLSGKSGEEKKEILC